jgi:hypothetical protein
LGQHLDGDLDKRLTPRRAQCAPTNRWEELMDADLASKSVYSTEARELPHRPLPSDESARAAALCLTRRASLIVRLLLSLGLWGAIWAAVASLASAMLR